MTSRFAAGLIALALSGAALAAEWSSYGNARFGYVVEIPPGFTAIREADNSDGGTSRSAMGHATLSVWGANLLDQTFTADVASRMSSATSEGWVLGYKVVTGRGANWSGLRGDRILYAHAVPRCRDQAAFVQIEYDASAKAAFDPIVSRVARSLRADGAC